jgi:phenylpropionate dioxygenase-like ring-hydroxylating dioxygenase large terminal subunit
MSNHPMASTGLITYRYRVRYGFIYIGARTDNEALSEAQRSTDDTVTPDRLERHNGQRFVGVLS